MARNAIPAGLRRYQPDPAVVGRAVDLIVVKETDERFVDRIGRVRDACQDVGVDVQPLVYTQAELDGLLENGSSFLETALAEGVVAYEAKG